MRHDSKLEERGAHTHTRTHTHTHTHTRTFTCTHAHTHTHTHTTLQTKEALIQQLRRKGSSGGASDSASNTVSGGGAGGDEADAERLGAELGDAKRQIAHLQQRLAVSFVLTCLPVCFLFLTCQLTPPLCRSKAPSTHAHSHAHTHIHMHAHIHTHTFTHAHSHSHAHACMRLLGRTATRQHDGPNTTGE